MAWTCTGVAFVLYLDLLDPTVPNAPAFRKMTITLGQDSLDLRSEAGDTWAGTSVPTHRIAAVAVCKQRGWFTRTACLGFDYDGYLVEFDLDVTVAQATAALNDSCLAARVISYEDLEIRLDMGHNR